MKNRELVASCFKIRHLNYVLEYLVKFNLINESQIIR